MAFMGKQSDFRSNLVLAMCPGKCYTLFEGQLRPGKGDLFTSGS